MNALILSCSAGGGHNAAAVAIKEELLERGHSVVMLDPYALVSDKLAQEIGEVYASMMRRSSHVYGMIYNIGGAIRKVPGQSPIYYANVSVAKKLEKYLRLHDFDIIIMPHLYPAELITYLKRHDVQLPTTVYIATDYVCIPYTEETDCDYYIVPSEKLASDYAKHGIPKEKILAFGVPVRKIFELEITKEEARQRLGLEQEKQYTLVSGGSWGAGKIEKAIGRIRRYYKKHEIDGQIIVVCGNNERLYRRLRLFYRDDLILLQKTKLMAEYMRACDLYISKPSGMASTEAATVGIPCILTTPLPGCEKYNMKYFRKNGICIGTRYVRWSMGLALSLVENPDISQKMLEDQKNNMLHEARTRICDWIEDT